VPNDERDKPGIRVPPPPIYLLALLLGLLLNRRMHVPFLPRGVARLLGWPLVGGGRRPRHGSLGRCAEPTLRCTSTSLYPELSRTVRFASLATPATCL
jgi:hypothetical protein